MSVTLNPHASAASIMEMPMVEIERLSFWYGAKQALKDVAMSVSKHRITAYIGPSGCGKSTLLRCLNRMNDLVDGVRMEGTIVIVTHNMQQAARVSNYTGFMLLGELVEFGVTRQLFTNPRDKRTEDYITGRFG